MPLPDAGRDPAMPASLQEIAAEMARDYTTSDYWWREEPLPRVARPVEAESVDTQSPHRPEGV